MRLLNIWTLLFIVCAFLTLMFSLGFSNERQVDEVLRRGQLVEVEILRSTEAQFGKRHSYTLYFTYNGQQEHTYISRDYSYQIKNTRSTRLLHLAEYPHIFIDPGKKEKGELLSAYILVGLTTIGAGYCLIKSISN
jgi:hypothetical protein